MLSKATSHYENENLYLPRNHNMCTSPKVTAKYTLHCQRQGSKDKLFMDHTIFYLRNSMLGTEYLLPPNSCWSLIIPKVMVSGGSAFGQWLGHESGAFMKVISDLKGAWRDQSPPLALCEDTWPSMNQERTHIRPQIRLALILNFPPSRTMKSKFQLSHSDLSSQNKDTALIYQRVEMYLFRMYIVVIGYLLDWMWSIS